ncbi:MAG: hypothetical protein N0C90_11590 [Candidatus Thiodiazotropha endolucinida]|nr:hypothetical protein [Candidatus Thiodiazotropha taylori]MCW4262002.1 hypothetical protein [Candidatus Thiodiazotropha endolucinida]
MSARLWYPQLDVYDAIRRMCVLLQYFDEPPGAERLYISDFFLANPPLLHRTSMTAEVRKSFMELKIPRPDKVFVSFPSSLLLFHKMEPIQKEAINALKGRGLLSLDDYKLGKVVLTGKTEELFSVDVMSSEDEQGLCTFLATKFSSQSQIGNQELRRKTGLRRSF